MSAAEAHVDQLRIQANMERIQISQASKELLDYVASNEHEDSLVNPGDYNPFKERKGCTLL